MDFRRRGGAPNDAGRRDGGGDPRGDVRRATRRMFVRVRAGVRTGGERGVEETVYHTGGVRGEDAPGEDERGGGEADLRLGTFEEIPRG